MKTTENMTDLLTFVITLIVGIIAFLISGSMSVATLWAVGTLLFTIVGNEISYYIGSKMFGNRERFIEYCDEFWFGERK